MRIRWRGFELPSTVTCEQESLTSTYGKFIAEPFERGFGTTVGNALRRVLLSSLEGSAVTQVKIQGSQHEFTSVPGVIEDVTDIIANIKSIVVKNHSESTKVIRIEKNTKGPVTAGDIHTDGTVEVINKNLQICTLTADSPFSVEMVIENGRGYISAAEHSPNVEIGIIPVDAVYSPVVRVRYEIEETRVGQKTNYDKLTLEIWTNGSIGPEMALVEAAKIMRKHLNPFVQYSELGSQLFAEPRTGSPAIIDAAGEAKLNMSLAELNLSVRAMNCLESENIHSVGDLVLRSPDQLLEVRNFGDTTLKEVTEKLTSLGLRLGMRIPDGGLGLDELRLSHRTLNGLRSENITTLTDLITSTEADLLDIKDFDLSTLNEIKTKLRERGLRLQSRALVGQAVQSIARVIPATGPETASPRQPVRQDQSKLTSVNLRGTNTSIVQLDFSSGLPEGVVNSFLAELEKKARIAGGTVRILSDREDGQ